MVARKQILIEIKARANQAIAQIGKLNKGLNKTRTAAEAAASKGLGKLSAANDKLNSAFDKVTGAAKKFRGALALAGTAIAAAIAIDKFAERARELNLVLDNVPFSVGKAQEAVGGLVRELELSKLAIEANRFGVTKNSEEFAKLAKAGSRLARSVGRDAKTGVADLSLALARQSPKILDNLGIILKLGEANKIYAKRLGKTVQSLTEAERAEAFQTIGLERAVAASEKVIVTTDGFADGVGRLKIALLDITDGAIKGTSNALGKMVDAFVFTSESFGEAVGQLVLDMDGLFAGVQDAARNADLALVGQQKAFEARAKQRAEAEGKRRQAVLDLRKVSEIAEERGKKFAKEAQKAREKTIADGEKFLKQLRRRILEEKKLEETLVKRSKAAAQLESQRLGGAFAAQDIRGQIGLAEAGARGARPGELRELELEAGQRALESQRILVKDRLTLEREAANESIAISQQFAFDERLATKQRDAFQNEAANKILELERTTLEARQELRQLELQDRLLVAEKERADFEEIQARRKERADEALREQEKQQKDLERKMKKQAREQQRFFESIAGGVINTFDAMGEAFRQAGDAGLKSGDKIAAGLAAGTSALLKEIRKQMIVLAVSETAKGIAAAASFNAPQAAAHFAAAAAAGAGAAAAGGGARALDRRSVARVEEGLEARADRERAGKAARREARSGVSTEAENVPTVGPLNEEERGRQRQAQQGRSPGAANGGTGDTFNFTIVGKLGDEAARDLKRQLDRSGPGRRTG